MEYTKINTPFGPWILVADKGEIVGFGAHLPIKEWQATPNDRNVTLQQATREIAEYFAGKRKKFSFPIGLRFGTPFQQQAWRTLLKIPYGKTWSYKDQAEQLKRRKAFRAVGSANGKNPLCIIVPCHRVIASNGGLGGYSGGLDVKKSLLALETHHS